MSSSSLFASIFAQATTAATTASTGTGADGTAAGQPQGEPVWMMVGYGLLIVAMLYFGILRPQAQAKKKVEETVKGVKTGDKVVTSSGIHGVISNVKDSTVILKIADNVKIEIEKTSIDKITRPDSSSSSEKPAAAKA